MSVEMMVAVFATSQSKGAARLVLLALANEASATGEVTAYRRSQSWIAKQCNMTVRGVRKSVDGLTALGELEVLREGAGYSQADYRIVLGEEPRSARVRNHVPLGEEPRSAPSSRSSRSNPIISSTDVDETFEKFWKAYPRKTAKKASERAFKAAVKRGDLEKVRAGLKAHLPQWTAGDPRFIPHASTWLNGERYLDHVLSLGSPTAVAPKRGVRRFERDDGTPYWVDGDENIYEEDPNA